MKRVKGKLCNRCKKGHVLLSTALHGLHIQSFLKEAQRKDISFTSDVWLEKKSDQLPISLMELSNQYQKHVNDKFLTCHED